jgi:hypothetical protein
LPAIRLTTLLVGILLALAAQPAGARAQGLAPGGAADGDSASARDEAETAQADFERARIRHLPWTWSAPPPACDETVGRFCFWHGEGDGWTPAPEDPAIGLERERLLDRLAGAALALPGDGWIAGQRVRYLVEAGRPAEALAIARSCRAEGWWCRALEGHALHAAGDFAAAERAFDAALAAMPAGEREPWTDLELLLDSRLRRVWKELGPGERAELSRRLWWLADPLWSVAGNERRSEHFARLVLDRLQARARSPYDIAWGRDLRELTVRYGWPVGWERARARSGALGDGERPSIVGHDAPAGRPFFPPHEIAQSPAGARAGDWPLDAPAPRETYAPSYADSVVDLAAQIVVFRRGDRAMVVAGYDLHQALDPQGADRPAPGAGASAVDTVEAALVVDSGPEDGAYGSRGIATRRGRARGALTVEVPWAPAVVSVEARAADRRLAARDRRGLELPIGRPAVSDLLLLAGADPLPASLGEASARARGSNRVAPGEELGVYFEIYPPAGAGGLARFTLGLRDERDGFWRGLGTALGIGASRTGEVHLAWSEEIAAATAVHPRALVISLPALPPGEYALTLEVELAGGTTFRTERRLRVR